MKQYDTRHGKTFEVVELNTGHIPKKSKRKQFEPEWIKLPLHWVKALRRSRSVRAYELAHTILVEAFKNHNRGEVVLSTEATGMPRNSKVRAARELARLGLIKTLSEGNQAVRVTPITIKNKK
jgi:hypothetical protein